MIELQRFRHLFKEGSWIFVGQAMAVIGSLIGVRLLTSLLNPTAYGEVALAMTVIALVHQTILGPLSQGAMRFYAPALEQDDIGGYLNALRRLIFLATGVVFILLFLGISGLVIARKFEWIGIAIASLIVAILNSYSSMIGGIQNAARQRSVVAFHQGLEPLAKFIFAAVLILCLGATSTVTVIGYAIGNFLLLTSQIIFCLKIIPKDTNWKSRGDILQQQIWNYAWPFSIWGIFYWVQSASDRWALGLFATTEEIGLYAVLFQLGYYPMSMATGMVVQLITPIFYQRAGDGTDLQRKTIVNKLGSLVTKLSILVTVVSFLIVSLLHTQIFQIFVATEYRSVSYLMPWVILSGGLFAAGQTIALNLMSQMKTQIMMKVKIVTSLVSVVITFVGAYYYRTEGIVIASVLSSLIYYIWMTFLQKNDRKIMVGLEK